MTVLPLATHQPGAGRRSSLRRTAPWRAGAVATTHAVGRHRFRALWRERLHPRLGLAAPAVCRLLHRDDFAQRGLASSAQTQLHFDVNGADVLVLDDVLYTGRTVRGHQ